MPSLQRKQLRDETTPKWPKTDVNCERQAKLARLAGSKNQAAYATENRSLTFRAGRARPLHRIVVGGEACLHRIVVGARHASTASS